MAKGKGKGKSKSKGIKQPTASEKVVNPAFKDTGAKGSLSGADITDSAQSVPKKVTKTT